MGTPRTSAPGPAGRQSGCMKRERSASPARRCVCSSTGGSFLRRQTPSVGRLDLARHRGLGQGQQPPAEGALSPAGGIHCLGFQWRYAYQPSGPVSAGRVQIRQSPEPHPSDGEAAAADAGHREDHGTGRAYSGPLAGSGTTVLAAVQEGYTATGIEVTDTYAELARERIRKELACAA